MATHVIRVPCEDGRTFELPIGSTALLAIDFQRDFLDADGGCADDGTTRLRNAVPAAQRALDAARAAGLAVIHTREAYAPDLSDVTELKRQMGYVGVPGPLGKTLVRGEPGCEIVPEMLPEEDEVVIDKPGFSAFYRTGFESHLQGSGVTHLVFTGVTSQCCVHSTLRDAVERGFFCLTLDDACAAGTPELDDAVRRVIRGERNLFGWISSTADFVGALAALPS